MNQPNPTIDQLVAAYNAHDARAFANLFTEDARVYEHPDILTQQGRDELFRYYEEVFAQYPQNQTTVLHRIIIGNHVVDHEQVRRSPSHEPFAVLTIYELTDDGLIARLDFVRDARNVVQTN